jgi:hypothetical protein
MTPDPRHRRPNASCRSRASARCAWVHARSCTRVDEWADLLDEWTSRRTLRAVVVRKRVSDLDRLGSTADVKLDVMFDDRPCIVLFESSVGLLSLVDAQTERQLASVWRRPSMKPLRLVADEIVWDARRLRLSSDVVDLADGADFVYRVNSHGADRSDSQRADRPQDASIHAALAPPPVPGVSPDDDDRPRWQFAVINVGMFNASDRFQRALGAAASQGWELVGVYDKASNWLSGMEKGFILLKRHVPTGVRLREDEWCISLSMVAK